jgi:hypothetical protein
MLSLGSEPVDTVQWRGLFLVVMMLALAPALHAASFSLSVDPLDNEIVRNESASYTVTISNLGNLPGDYQVYTVDPSWNTKTDPLSIIIPNGSSRTFTLFLRPTTEAGYGTQGVPVTFKEVESGSVITKTLVLSLRGADTPGREYAPTVALDILMPYEIDPRNPIPMRVVLRNRNPLNIANLSVYVSSPHFNASTTLNLGPLSEKTREIEGLVLAPNTPPGEQELLVQLNYEDKVINSVTKNYQVKEYTQVKQRVTEKPVFFKNERTIEVINEGNVKNTAVVSVPTSFIKSLFISSEEPFESEVRDGQRVISWQIPLDPYQQKSLTYTENYRILVLLFILALIGAASYFVLRSPVIAIKEAVAVKHGDGVSDIKVRVFVRNRSAKSIQGLQVTDKVPSLADVVRSESPGSMSPTKIATHEKQGTLLRWDLQVLEPFEERILTYHVKSKLKIIGRMRLPNARIRFIANGKDRVVYSNNIELVEKFRDK